MRPFWILIALIFAAITPISAADGAATSTSMDVLTPQQWRELDASVDRALAWIASQQQADGSFPTLEVGQPGVTSLCVIAFFSRGYMPGEGPFGEHLLKAIDYTIGCQKSNGLVTNVTPEAYADNENAAHTAAYNHAIAGVMLAEAYGMHPRNSDRIRQAVEKAVAFTLDDQKKPKRDPREIGGWRYVKPRREGGGSQSDLSVTSWQLMFLRSARNAGFAVPVEAIDQAVGYVKQTFRSHQGAFVYGVHGDPQPTRGMAGAGIVSLALSGLHETPEAQQAGRWLLAHPFDVYNDDTHWSDRYHYSVYYATLGMFQLGGEYWAQFFPRLVPVLTRNQNADGSWDVEATPPDADGRFGNTYTTALVVIALTTPYQLLPIYQR